MADEYNNIGHKACLDYVFTKFSYVCQQYPAPTPVQSTVHCDQLYHLTRDYHFVIAWSLVLSVTPSIMSQSCMYASSFCFVLPLFQSIGMVTAI